MSGGVGLIDLFSASLVTMKFHHFLVKGLGAPTN